MIWMGSNEAFWQPGMNDDIRQIRSRMRAQGGDVPLSPAEVDRWCEQAAAVPDIRLTKVMRIRRAIVTRAYDEDAGLEQSLDVIRDELGVLCDLDDPTSEQAV